MKRSFYSVYLVFFFSFAVSHVCAQLIGHLFDSDSLPLAFATIYVEGSTIGSSTNEEGAYRLDLAPGFYRIRYQYVGYKTKVLDVTIGDGPVYRDVILERENYTLDEAVIYADREDPAYQIIRNAQRKRKYHRDLISTFSCKSYIKASHRFLSTPERLFGTTVGDMGGILDSTGQGIFYLSESVSEVYYQRPKTKEIMISSIVSGDSGGYSFNQAGVTDLNFYNNTIEIERHMVSPIAAGAMAYYNYRLEGAKYDDSGRLINKIKVSPKNSTAPCFSGYIYIVEGSWNIHSLELSAHSAALKISVLDSLHIRQQYVETKDGFWVVLNQYIAFQFDLFGFKGMGSYAANFSEYNLQAQFPKGFFGSTLLEVKDSSNLKSDSYWQSIRPVPLTDEEIKDYIKKDSLQDIWNSKSYRDSIDRKNNRFKISDLLTGYSYRRSFKGLSMRIPSPLTTLMFNPVQGYYLDLNMSIKKKFDKQATRWWRLNPLLQYGFSDQKLRGLMTFAYRFNSINYATLSAKIASDVVQVNNQQPISPALNSYYNLLLKENYIRLYRRQFAQVQYKTRLLPGLKSSFSASFAKRHSLVNNTNFSYFNSDVPYTPNQITREQGMVLPFESHNLFSLNIALEWTPGQRYISYPKYRHSLKSRFPTLDMQLQSALPWLGSDSKWQHVELSIKDDFNFATFGTSKFQINIGSFFNANNVNFPDFRHFNGNQTLFYDKTNFGTSYFALPYYSYSTDQNYLSLFVQHRFKGKILDQIPLLRQLGLETVLAYKLLKVKQKPVYSEWSVGIDKIGFGILRPLRIDAVWSTATETNSPFNIRLGVGF